MFIAHKNDLPLGQYKVIKQARSTRVLLNDGGRFLMQYNICPHQGSRIRTQDQGKGLAAVCPFHGWSWDTNGFPKGNGTTACENAYRLSTTELHEWNGFLFDRSVPVDIDISGDYELVSYRADKVAASPLVVMDLFLDVDHIPVVHPKLYDRIDIPRVDDIEWKSWAGGSAQLVPGVPDEGSDWHRYVQGRNLTHSAAWIALYPGTQFEWQPGGVFVQVNEAVDDETTLSHIFKYRDRT